LQHDINNMSKVTEAIERELRAVSDEEKRIILPRFFKTGKGEYGEGDKFLGVVVPNIRSVATCYMDVDFSEIENLLASPWHEVRMCGLLIMVESIKKTMKKSWQKAHSTDETETLRRRCFDVYLRNTSRINNWDLVDLSAPTIVGMYLTNKDRSILYTLSRSSLLWEQRIAVVSTFTFIRNNDFRDTYLLAEQLLHHPHDLMQKAVGWMLREAGKRDKPLLMDFLDEHSMEMPRTMLRYAIEKFTDAEREYYMKRV
jgi:3-methyladenine DNA glycosylase AlkD